MLTTPPQKKIVLVMTDPLDEKNAEMVNPIDTLSKLHKLAGDYIRDKKKYCIR